ncbi:MAG: uroporphyrinogen-III synthase [Pseudomonadota bacterium]
MRWLVTRPRTDAERVAKALADIGHRVLICPLTSVRFTNPPLPDWTTSQAILATSRHGVVAWARLTERRDVPIFTVGSATADVARYAGFREVKSADGDADALVDLVLKEIKPDNGSLIRVRGAVARGSVAERLSKAGFQVHSTIVYDVETATHLPDEAKQALMRATVDGVLFFSPRSAALFARLVDDAALGGCLSDLMALCLSPAIAKCLDQDRWRAIRTASSKDLAALIALAGEVAR